MPVDREHLRSPSHVTTARFDADLWAALVEQAGRLDVARAELIRAAVREYVARLSFEDRISVMEGRLARVERVLVRVARKDVALPSDDPVGGAPA